MYICRVCCKHTEKQAVRKSSSISTVVTERQQQKERQHLCMYVVFMSVEASKVVDIILKGNQRI